MTENKENHGQTTQLHSNAKRRLSSLQQCHLFCLLGRGEGIVDMISLDDDLSTLMVCRRHRLLEIQSPA